LFIVGGWWLVGDVIVIVESASESWRIALAFDGGGAKRNKGRRFEFFWTRFARVS
jgi:hypothetical protein